MKIVASKHWVQRAYVVREFTLALIELNKKNENDKQEETK